MMKCRTPITQLIKGNFQVYRKKILIDMSFIISAFIASNLILGVRAYHGDWESSFHSSFFSSTTFYLGFLMFILGILSGLEFSQVIRRGVSRKDYFFGQMFSLMLLATILLIILFAVNHFVQFIPTHIYRRLGFRPAHPVALFTLLRHLAILFFVGIFGKFISLFWQKCGAIFGSFFVLSIFIFMLTVVFSNILSGIILFGSTNHGVIFFGFRYSNTVAIALLMMMSMFFALLNYLLLVKLKAKLT